MRTAVTLWRTGRPFLSHERKGRGTPTTWHDSVRVVSYGTTWSRRPSSICAFAEHRHMSYRTNLHSTYVNTSSASIGGRRLGLRAPQLLDYYYKLHINYFSTSHKLRAHQTVHGPSSAQLRHRNATCASFRPHLAPVRISWQ